MNPFSENSSRGDLEKEIGDAGQLVMPGESVPPILTAPVRAALHQWLYEMNAEQELLAVGLKPRTRTLLSGPPGCGKTTLAHHIAARLGMPMLVVQAHDQVDKYLGATGRNIGKLFRTARRSRTGLALFFDEFDALAKKRENLSAAGADNERANITITLLQEFDRYDGLLFAATNVIKEIDPAIWRRFQMQIEIGFPGPDERFAIVKMYMAPFAVEDATTAFLAQAFSGASPALIKDGCEAIKRTLVLGPRMGLSADLASVLDRFADSSSVAEGMPEPELWTSRRAVLAGAAGVPWPPVREG